MRKADGSLVPVKLPEPHKAIIRAGMLGNANKLIREGLVYRRLHNKGRQEGFSMLLAMETILIAESFPNTCQYYVAVEGRHASEWLRKLDQLVRDANHWPPELGGGPILNPTNMKNVMTKVVNNSIITGFTANPAAIHGDTGINVIIDEFAWMIILKNQQAETYTAIKYFLRQGGQLTIQSTPRVSTDMFWEINSEPERYGFETFYCPVISNLDNVDINEPFIILLDDEKRKFYQFKEIDEQEKNRLRDKYLNKKNFYYDKKLDAIKQHIVIPYPWINLIDLEKDRYADVEIFKQENLGIPVDEQYKLIKGEWIYQNLEEGTDWENRRDSFNPFVIGIDFAQKRDLTIVTVCEQIGSEYFERFKKIVAGHYPAQANEINAIIQNFLPVRVSTDNTGVGIAVNDILQKVMKNPSILERVNFTGGDVGTKAQLAQNFKTVCQEGKYHALNYTDDHQLALKHILKVEKQVLESTIKYTGKGVDQEGRDDGFWSAALCCFENPLDGSVAKNIKARFGSVKSAASKMPDSKSAFLKQFEREQRKLSAKVEDEKEEMSFFNDAKMEQIKTRLNTGIIICRKTNAPVKPIDCLKCELHSCKDYETHKRIIQDGGIKYEVFKRWMNVKTKTGSEIVE